jgi:LDH2 family malate/lactate/ureidoglycolate dehydrogenase
VSERTYGQWWSHVGQTVTVEIEALRAFGVEALRKAGAGEDDAAYLFEIFLEKTLQGDHARGVDKFMPMVRGALGSRVDLNPEIRRVRETPSTAFLDGGVAAAKGLVCRAAMDLAIEKARTTGIGCVAARNTTHSLTPMMRQAVDAGMVGIGTIASPPLVAPLGGTTALVGNAPVAFGIPAGERDPVLLDMSLTNSSGAGLFLAAEQGLPAPEGAYLDPAGRPTTDVATHLAEINRVSGKGLRGSLAVLGNAHKGYGLLFAVDLLTRILAHADQPWEMEDVYAANYGATFIAIDIEAFAPLDVVRKRVDEYIETLKASPRRDDVDEILYPGEKSQRLRKVALERGVVELPVDQLRTLRDLGAELSLSAVLPLDG